MHFSAVFSQARYPLSLAASQKYSCKIGKQKHKNQDNLISIYQVKCPRQASITTDHFKDVNNNSNVLERYCACLALKYGSLIKAVHVQFHQPAKIWRHTQVLLLIYHC